MQMNEMRRNDVDDKTNAGIKKEPSVAIVILNWNGKGFLQQFLPSVVSSTYTNKRVIVADNASTDDSIHFLQQHFPAVEIIRNTSNEGFAKGYNTALKQVESDYYVLLNSDVEVSPGWIEPVIELMQADETIAACQPKLLSYQDKSSFEYAGACGGWIDNFGYPFSRGRIFDKVEEDKGQYDKAEPCFWASGAALFTRANLFHAAGGFDDHFFAHQEEIDLCWRLQLMGYKIFVQPASRVYHVGGGTLPKGNNRKVFLNYRNNLIMITKNSSFMALLWKLPFRMLLDAVSAWQFLFKGDRGYFIAVLNAHLHFMKWLLTGRKQAPYVKHKQFNLRGLYHGSVVWQHFVQKKNTFSEIVGRK